MRKFIINNRQKRKYVRRKKDRSSSSRSSSSMPLALKLLPSILISLAFLAATMFVVYAQYAHIYTDFTRLKSFSVKGFFETLEAFFSGIYSAVLWYSDVIINYSTRTEIWVTNFIYHAVISIFKLLTLVFNEIMLGIYSLFSATGAFFLTIFKAIADFWSSLINTLLYPFRFIGKQMEPLKPLADRILWLFSSSAAALTYNLKEIFSGKVTPF